MTRFAWFALVVGSALAFAGCSRQHVVEPAHDSPRDPLAPGSLPAPPQPGGVAVEAIGPDFITLRWTMSDSANVSRYRVYRTDAENPDPRVADSSTIQRVTVRRLQVGTIYGLRVAAVNSAGLQGPASELVQGRPAVLSVAMNGNDAVTNDPDVLVSLTATGFDQVRLAQSLAELPSATYLGIPTTNPLVGFTLSGADGAKNLFGQFRDTNNGNESTVVTDEIVLDRDARIETVTQNTLEQVKTAGDVIHFTLIANELDGSAVVDIGQARTSIRLFDDGSNGDATAGNGVYEVNYTVEPAVDCNQVPVVGRFVDRAGNVGSPFQAAGTVTIRNPPQPVTLVSVVAQPQGRAQLQWTQSGAVDFQAYHVWHASSSPVLSSPNRSLDTTITIRTTTNATIKGLSPGTTYQFLVQVADLTDNRSSSNELGVVATATALLPTRTVPYAGERGAAATMARAAGRATTPSPKRSTPSAAHERR